MKIIESLIPGSAAWLKSRSASKAPAMMGVSKFQSRSELIKQMATGLTKEVDPRTKARFDEGHLTETLAREIAEDILDEGLSPVCGSTDDGYLTASFDGLSFDGRIGWEHKLWNESLAADVRANNLPEEYKWQMDQQILVGGLEYVLFMCSDGSYGEKCVFMEYRSTPERAAALIAGWQQFDKDMKGYAYVEAAPVVAAAPIIDLPAIIVTVDGALSIQTNFATWGIELNNFIARIPEKPSTDQEFADCKSAVAALKKAEAQLDAEESRVLSLVPSIDDMKREKKFLRDLSSTTRLALEKLVTARDNTLKLEIIQSGKDELEEHVATLNIRLGKPFMPDISADWATAIKGKKLYSAMRSAVSDLVAAKKIESNALADRIQINLTTLDAHADHKFLFPDLAQIVNKPAGDFMDTVNARISTHKIAEEKRLAEEREKMRLEEEAKAEAKIKAENVEKQKVVATQTVKTPVPSEPPVSTSKYLSPQQNTRDRLLNSLQNIVRELTDLELSNLIAYADQIVFNREEVA